MLVLDFVALHNLVLVEDRVSLDLNHLVNQGLHNANAHLVVARLGLVVDRDQVQMDAEKYSLDLKFIDELFKDLAQFEEALDD